MKSKILALLFALCTTVVFAQDKYYFGDSGKFNSEIPTPESFFGFRIGTSLVRYDKVVEYFKLLASKSDRASVDFVGYSWQKREQIKLFITSPENQKNLENIRKEHLKLVDPSAKVDYNSQKVIVELAYNVHGGEIAGTDAAVLAAYYLVATEDPDMVRRLSEAVILVDPSQNPDGRERAVNFINGFESYPAIADANDIGHSGGWTPHRGSHFWNDMNRDWLPLSQVESKNKVAYYHKWYPNVYLDFHEMGSGSTYYFEPSPLTSWNNILPASTYNVLTNLLAKHFAAALDKIGSLYFTKEAFTNLSPIYGSTYPDYQGGVGITLEVGSTSGVEIETDAGIRKFARNLKDNFEISIAGVRAAVDEKETFLKEQKAFFESALTQADKLAAKSIVFGSDKDANLNRVFVDYLLKHNIEVYALDKDLSLEGKNFKAGKAYVAQLRQPQFRILQSIFEENETNGFDKTTTFYDISGWSTAHGFGIPFVKAKTVVAKGNRITEAPVAQVENFEQSTLAYAFSYADFLAPKALYALQTKGLVSRVAHLPFKTSTAKGEVEFSAGSVVIPVAYQSQSVEEIHAILKEVAQESGVQIYALNNGFSVGGIDLGSNNMKVVKKPTVALVSGQNWTTFGEVWDALSNTYGIPVVKLNAQTIERVDLNRYTSIVLTGGQYSKEFATQLATWVNNGGTLISLSGANAWVNSAVFPKVNRGAKAEENEAPQVGRFGAIQGERIYGIIVNAELNETSPLSFGLADKSIYTLRNSTVGLDSTTVEKVILKSTDKLVNGYVESSVLPKVKNNIIIGTASKGKGGVVYFAENPGFRGYWHTSTKILVNAIFFGANSGMRRF